MPIEMPRGLPFSVDTWTPASNRKRHHFLTHAHKDHLSGIASRSSRPIYSTRLTKALALRYFPQLDDSLFVEVEVGGSIVVDDPDGAFTVTAFDANHCPGAVMFLFEGEFGNVLHTGDCRLTPDCLQNLPMKYLVKKRTQNECHLDYLFLDCSFGKCHLKMPSMESAIQQVISCIWEHPNAPVVYLSCDILGREQVLIEISKTFGSNIFVDKLENPDFFHALLLTAPEIISEDVSSRFQVLGLSRLYEKASEEFARAHANHQPEPLLIRPSAQWYATNPHRIKSEWGKSCPAGAEKDEFGVWHVCHSMHSSREELEWALQFLQPKWVVSTTPPILAMDLNYVKKNCYKTHITSDDPLWKLINGSKNKSASTHSVSQTQNNDVSSFIEVPTDVEISELQPEVPSKNQFELKLDLSPKTLPLTLFGRARYALKDPDAINIEAISSINKEAENFCVQDDTTIKHASIFLGGEFASSVRMSSSDSRVTDQPSSLGVQKIVEHFPNKSENSDDERAESSSGYSETSSISVPSIQKSVVAVKWDISDSIKQSRDYRVGASVVTPSSISEPILDRRLDVKKAIPCIGSSSNFSPSLRNLYKSMNVAIPRPLPSLTDLMKNCKRAKKLAQSENT